MPVAFADSASPLCPAYDRDKWITHWSDADGDCKDTRQEVLEEESAVPAALSANGCKVYSGRWRDPYTGKTHDSPGELHIDHRVPLKEAHDSGGHAWDEEKKRDYANDLSDPEHLVATAKGVNSSKGERDPAEWPQPYKDAKDKNYWKHWNEEQYNAFRAEYAHDWVRIKRRWGLTADEKEVRALRKLLGPEAPLPEIAKECVSPAVPARMGSPAKKDSCCKVCGTGLACGNSCISRSQTCRKQLGCACQR